MNKVAVLGSGVTGTAVTRYLHDHGYPVVHPEGADVVVVSPGIPPSEFPVSRDRCISEIEFSYQLFRRSGRVPILIGVTGTNGKSTVTAMIAHLAQIPYAGNIGVPLIDWVDRSPPAIVVELSSYQLETIDAFRPNIAVLTTLSPDHLARHGTMANYAAAKARIFENQGKDDWVIAVDDGGDLATLVAGSAVPTCWVSSTSETVLAVNAFADTLQTTGQGHALIGAHNRLNAALAIETVRRLGIDDAQIWARLATYQALAHRIEWVGGFQQCQVYDDSKATNPESTQVAIRAFSGQSIRLLLGGKDKGLALDAFLIDVAASVAKTYVFGEIASRVQGILDRLGVGKSFAFFETLDQATDAAFQESTEGDIILLSPACSSFDQFRDFNHRGDHFKSYVRTHYY